MDQWDLQDQLVHQDHVERKEKKVLQLIQVFQDLPDPKEVLDHEDQSGTKDQKDHEDHKDLLDHQDQLPQLFSQAGPTVVEIHPSLSQCMMMVTDTTAVNPKKTSKPKTPSSLEPSIIICSNSMSPCKACKNQMEESTSQENRAKTLNCATQEWNLVQNTLILTWETNLTNSLSIAISRRKMLKHVSDQKHRFSHPRWTL